MGVSCRVSAKDTKMVKEIQSLAGRKASRQKWSTEDKQLFKKQKQISDQIIIESAQ